MNRRVLALLFAAEMVEKGFELIIDDQDFSMVSPNGFVAVYLKKCDLSQPTNLRRAIVEAVAKVMEE